MSELARELGLVIPEGRSSTARYGNNSTYGMYEFTDGTVCYVINYPESDQNLVAVDSHLGTPAPAELDLERIAKFSTTEAFLDIKDYI